jgi:hypothetical protein
MTHDGLLAKIDEEGEFLVQHFDSKPIVHSALRAVVELHKPCETTPPWEYVKYMACDACESWTNDGAYYLPYPCPTIQAIEKELG